MQKKKSENAENCNVVSAAANQRQAHQFIDCRSCIRCRLQNIGNFRIQYQIAVRRKVNYMDTFANELTAFQNFTLPSCNAFVCMSLART